ncbi:MAG TPA: glycosyltransferase family 4 protein [Candidatus Portnoybacteria bacterium]|nr:glycosyltransferase family 4 protein [Candidatus Portnoybacteria bacterium]
MPLLHYVRLWDQASSERVDYFIANSRTTQQRIKKYYRRDSQVIYPPVDVEKFTPGKENKGYFLIVSRLSPYKRIDLAVEAFNKLELPLIIIGQGPQRKFLQRLAQKNIKFLGWQPEEKVRQYYQNCQAFIFPGEEDFGITAVEAMAAGKPVLAFRKGGVTETVIEGSTGEFFDDPVPEVLADGVRRLQRNLKNYDSQVIRNQVEKFSRQRFEKEIKEFIESKLPGF